MKINLNDIDADNFTTRLVSIAGEECVLVNPMNFGCDWKPDTLHFRSSIWNSDGELISAGFPKFFNYGEKPLVSEIPTESADFKAITKIDGSLLIVSKYKGEVIIRTRRCVDATTLTNGDEIAILKEKYPLAFDVPEGNSYLFEWVSPTHRIVIKYNEIDIKLIGSISHKDYSLMQQHWLDSLAVRIGVSRPLYYSYPTLIELAEDVSKFVGIEGLCVYTNNDQTIHKFKASVYLKLHRMKSELACINKVLALYLEIGTPTYDEFYKYVCDNLDYEIAEDCKGNMSKLCDLKVKVDGLVCGFNTFIDKIKSLPTRKDQAIAITQTFGDSGHSDMLFTLFDGKTLTKEQMKKLFLQKIKKV